jgi:pantetheine-phosphate adenylyltransferase
VLLVNTQLHDDRALLPGSYDPVTSGHIDVIRRAASLFRELWVAVVRNPEKDGCFSVEERVALLGVELDGIPGIRVETFEGLTALYAAQIGARWIVRGLRSSDDATFEIPMAHSNRRCGPAEVETLFLPTSPELAFVSSRLVRQIAAQGGRLDPFVPTRIENALRRKFGPARWKV